MGRSRVVPDTLDNLLIGDKYYMVDEDFFFKSPELDAYTLYVMDVAPSPYVANFCMADILAVAPGNEDAKRILMDMPGNTPVAVEIIPDGAARVDETRELAERMKELYGDQPGYFMHSAPSIDPPDKQVEDVLKDTFKRLLDELVKDVEKDDDDETEADTDE